MSIIARRRWIACVVALAGAWTGCLSPTLPPLPPPGQPSVIQPVGDGELLVEGTLPVQEAKLLLLNHATDEIHGQFVHDGTYSVLLPARAGDRVDLWYSTEGVDSPVFGFNAPREAAAAPAAASPSSNADADSATGTTSTDAAPESGARPAQ